MARACKEGVVGVNCVLFFEEALLLCILQDAARRVCTWGLYTIGAGRSLTALGMEQLGVDAAAEEVFCVFVDEVDVAAAHAAGEQHAVDVLDVGSEFIAAGAFEHGVMGVMGLADPAVVVGVIDEVWAEDDADVVEFEALGGVDASHLVDPFRAIGPFEPGRYAWGEGLAFSSFPGHSEFADDHIVDQGAIGVGIAPGPAEAGDEAGGVRLFAVLGHDSLVEGGGGVGKSCHCQLGKVSSKYSEEGGGMRASQATRGSRGGASLSLSLP
jgi:hypothetical protein